MQEKKCNCNGKETEKVKKTQSFRLGRPKVLEQPTCLGLVL